MKLGVKQFFLVHVLDVFQVYPAARVDKVLMIMLICEMLFFAVLYTIDELRPALVTLLLYSQSVFINYQVPGILDLVTSLIELKLLLVRSVVLEIRVVNPIFFVPTTNFFFQRNFNVLRRVVFLITIMKSENELLLQR